jgi:uncharacterized protein YndB with AHSA1/START domain
MSTSTLDITIPTDRPVVSFTRLVKASPELVFKAFTEPEHLRNWWGPRRLEMVVCESDLRVGGRYRMVHRAPDGQEFAFYGEYREIDPPRRLVTTWFWDGAPDNEAIQSAEFEPVEGGTLVHGSLLLDSIVARDMHVANGMESGMVESYERLDEVLAALQS